MLKDAVNRSIGRKLTLAMPVQNVGGYQSGWANDL